MKLDKHYLDGLRREIQHKQLNGILRWAKDQFGTDMAMTTAAGNSGIVLMHHVKDLFPELEIYFIDTGYHFKETLDLIKTLRQTWGLNIQILKPYFSKPELKKIIGSKAYESNPNLCCHYNKVEPLLRILHTKKIWLSALRRDQTLTRAKIQKLEVDGRGVLKLNPLAYWTKKKIHAYIKKHDLPVNVLLKQGYSSIGCRPCTDKGGRGLGERDGRWKSCLKLECGLNL